ncbi:bifunctional helix-turn-helix transcriptional regulator/GNAT family N-acetyltransferase [Poritiphilus flavus]|nr:bifunctional helix-turn-helix transcriptional regulator/GNAT family N-acetyltransferase [Poritiphilus flavus]
MDTIDQLGYLAVGSRLRRIYEQLQASGDQVYKQAGFDFKSSWFPVFYTLANAKSALTVTEITSQIAFSNITVKNILRELEGQQLVTIVPNPADKRSKIVSLSAEGKKLSYKLEQLWSSFARALKVVFETGHPEMMDILGRIDRELELISLSDRVLGMQHPEVSVRNASDEEFFKVGQLMVEVYARLKGFPKEWEQPEYYKMLASVGELTKKPQTEILVAATDDGDLAGAVVFFGDVKYYGAGGSVTEEKDACGFRLLAVDEAFRGHGIGKLLTKACILKGKQMGLNNLIIHTTAAMQTAWKMYESMGFKRALDLDFIQEELPVYGFRLRLRP